MKKWIAVLLVACLLLPGTVALAAPGDAVVVYEGMEGFNDQVRTIAYADKTLYMLGYNAVYTYKDGALETWTFDTSAMEEEPENYLYLESMAIVTNEGEPLVFAALRGYDSGTEEWSLKNGGLYSVSLEETDGERNAVLSLHTEVDFETALESRDDDYPSLDFRMPFVQDGLLIGMQYGTENIGWFDLEDGSYHSMSDDSIGLIAPYKDGKVLAERAQYDSDELRVELVALDLESGEEEALCDMPVTGYSAPGMLCYDAQADMLYYAMNGELWRMPGMDPSAAESVADMPVDSWGDSQPLLTEDGFFITSDYQTVVKRNTDPSQRAQTSIAVQNVYLDLVDKTIYAFTGANPDVEVRKTDAQEDVIQAMMSQSSATDIYILNMSRSEYAALLERGYALELSDSETISDLISRMYPSIGEAVTRNGEIYALPVDIYPASVMSFDPESFTRLGLSEEDYPTTWAELLELLARLPEVMPNDDDVSIFEPYITQEGAKDSLFTMLINDYIVYISQPENEFTFDTPLLRGLLEKLDAIDFEALGLIPDSEAESSYSWSASSGDIMFTMYSSIGADYFGYENAIPMLLAMDEGVSPLMSVDMTAAVVNPFSKNPQTAVAFLEAMVENMEPVFCINTMPEENDPIRRSDYEETMKNYEESLEQMRADLAEADDEMKAILEASIAEEEEYIRQYDEEYSWDITSNNIEKYRSYAQYLVVAPVIGSNSEFYELLSQYSQGLIGVDEMISRLDQKLTMMQMEGY